VIKGLLVDEQDKHFLEEYSWKVRTRGYVVARFTTNYVTKQICLHRLITNCPSGMVVDHINHNPLDNRRANLRVCTQAENIRNTKLRSDSKTGYKGVHWSSQVSKYKVRIRLNGRNIHLGYFDTPEAGYEAYKAGAKKYHGEFAYV
jgi:hypothetical protein